MLDIQLQHIRRALALDDFDPVAAQRMMVPEPRSLSRKPQLAGSPRRASVVVLVFPRAQILNLVLIQRTVQDHDVHSGQISFPGGARETNETPLETALREANEELGLAPSEITILGQLSPLYIPPSDFEVTPFVGSVDSAPEWVPQASEVASVLEAPVSWLLDPAHKTVEDWQLQGHPLRVPWYNIHGSKVWGATAIILSELEQRLRHILNGSAN